MKTDYYTMYLRNRLSSVSIIRASYRLLSTSHQTNLKIALSNPIYKPICDTNDFNADKIDTVLIESHISKNRNDLYNNIKSYTELVADANAIVKINNVTIQPELFDEIENHIHMVKKDLLYAANNFNEDDKKHHLFTLEKQLHHTNNMMRHNISYLNHVLTEIKSDPQFKHNQIKSNVMSTNNNISEFFKFAATMLIIACGFLTMSVSIDNMFKKYNKNLTEKLDLVSINDSQTGKHSS